MVEMTSFIVVKTFVHAEDLEQLHAQGWLSARRGRFTVSPPLIDPDELRLPRFLCKKVNSFTIAGGDTDRTLAETPP